MNKLTLTIKANGQELSREFDLNAVLEKGTDLHEVAVDMLESIKDLTINKL